MLREKFYKKVRYQIRAQRKSLIADKAVYEARNLYKDSCATAWDSRKLLLRVETDLEQREEK